MFAMAGYGARIADACRDVHLSGRGRRRIAGEAGIEALSKRTEIACACVELLSMVSVIHVM